MCDFGSEWEISVSDFAFFNQSSFKDVFCYRVKIGNLIFLKENK